MHVFLHIHFWESNIFHLQNTNILPRMMAIPSCAHMFICESKALSVCQTAGLWDAVGIGAVVTVALY